MTPFGEGLYNATVIMPATRNNNKITIREAARIMGTFTTYVQSLIYSGRLKGVKKYGKWSLDRAEVEAYAVRLRHRRRSSSDVMTGDGDAA